MRLPWNKASQQAICTDFSNGKRHDFRLLKNLALDLKKRRQCQ